MAPTVLTALDMALVLAMILSRYVTPITVRVRVRVKVRVRVSVRVRVRLRVRFRKYRPNYNPSVTPIMIMTLVPSCDLPTPPPDYGPQPLPTCPTRLPALHAKATCLPSTPYSPACPPGQGHAKHKEQTGLDAVWGRGLLIMRVVLFGGEAC